MRHRIVFLIVIISSTLLVSAQDKTAYKKEIFKPKNGVDLPYRILMPKNYDATKKYPFILMLHGSGERGDDNELQLVHGASLFLKPSVRASYPAFVVFPQCPENDYWSNVTVAQVADGENRFDFKNGGSPTPAMKSLTKLIKHLVKSYPVDKSRMYVGGLSMGGMGTFEVVHRNPKRFAAAFPICGGANPETAKKIANINWWIFHGEDDKVVPPKYSVGMYESIKQEGGNVKFTLYPDTGHDSWTAAFAEPRLLSWLFSSVR